MVQSCPGGWNTPLLSVQETWLPWSQPEKDFSRILCVYYRVTAVVMLLCRKHYLFSFIYCYFILPSIKLLGIFVFKIQVWHLCRLFSFLPPCSLTPFSLGLENTYLTIVSRINHLATLTVYGVHIQVHQQLEKTVLCIWSSKTWFYLLFVIKFNTRPLKFYLLRIYFSQSLP